ncbi:MAG: prephenate dehydrogenase/arogenate dehydrogenase family protein [Deltaproteobacteria bacterium]|nr:prephenate dehydrogenase/arogenate dehydrogenase family protein [Deltaproteobacteria bacterium]
MNNVEIGIIGGTGGIGRWFADHFQKEGYGVHCTGRRSGMTIPEIAARCRVVIVSVPIAATMEVIDRVGPLLPEDSLLMDFTSLKEASVRRMLNATRAEVVGCHPLFGPDCPSLAGQNVILCPARGERWLRWTERLLVKAGARVTLASPQTHDRMMALVQGLTHLETVLMALTLRESGESPSSLEAFSTPVFRTRQAIAGKVLAHPALYAGLIAENRQMAAILDIYEEQLTRLRKRILEGDAAGLAALLEESGPLPDTPEHAEKGNAP